MNFTSAFRIVCATTIASMCMGMASAGPAHASPGSPTASLVPSPQASLASAPAPFGSSDEEAIVAASQGAVIPVRDAHGAIVGYAVDAANRARLDSLLQSMGQESTLHGGAEARAAQLSEWDWVRIGKCVVGITAFIALTVFPTARLAALATRLGSMVAKYGVNTVAKVLLRIAPALEPSMKDILAEISGVSMLGPCWS